jgi:choline kinase
MIGVILSAGIGSRLLPLTQEMPKCLIEVEGRSILDRQLEALAVAGLTKAVIVGGYRYRQIIAHLQRSPPPLPVEFVFNPFWSVASSIGSVWMAREHLREPFCLMNGDTVFDPPLIADAVARTASGVNLLVERLGAPALDDMLVTVANGEICAVAKDLPPEVATHRSLGVILSAGDGGAYRDALETVIAAPGGLNAYHHAIVARLARTSGVGAIETDRALWQEIDRPEDIAGWSGRGGQ